MKWGRRGIGRNNFMERKHTIQFSIPPREALATLSNLDAESMSTLQHACNSVDFASFGAYLKLTTMMYCSCLISRP